MDSSIPWENLPEESTDLLDRLQVERYRSGVRFNRQLSLMELAEVFLALFNFRPLIPDPDENHINFAIDDVLNEIEGQLGEKKVDEFIEEFLQIARIRNNTLLLAGSVLIKLQVIEYQIKMCCAMLDLKGLKLTLEDFHSDDPKRRRQTLGQLKNALLDNITFNEDFEMQFNTFVDDRNRFIHRLWTEQTDFDEESGLPRKEVFVDRYGFVANLGKQARETELVFRGLLAAMGEMLVGEDMATPEAVMRWKKYIPDFNSTLQQNPNESKFANG